MQSINTKQIRNRNVLHEDLFTFVLYDGMNIFSVYGFYKNNISNDVKLKYNGTSYNIGSIGGIQTFYKSVYLEKFFILYDSYTYVGNINLAYFTLRFGYGNILYDVNCLFKNKNNEVYSYDEDYQVKIIIPEDVVFSIRFRENTSFSNRIKTFNNLNCIFYFRVVYE